MDTCPQCNSLCVVPISYGKPSHELMEAAERGLVVLGGCIIDYSQPNAKCLKCQFAWQKPLVPGVPRVEFQSFVNQFRHFIADISANLESSLDSLSQESIEYGRALGQKTASTRLRGLMNSRSSISATLGDLAQRFSWDSEKLEHLLYGGSK